MKKWLLALFTALCVGTCAIGLAACGDDGGGSLPSTEHHFSTEWESDGAHHWHACTVHTDCGQRSGYASHIYGDDDECDVCHYVKPAVHKHTWVTKFDESNHWLETDCGEEHAVEKQEPEAHDFDGSGVCTNEDCGVKEIDTQVYAIYKTYTEGLGDEPLGFVAWEAELAEKGVVSVSINDTGDGVLHYAPEGDDEEGPEEVAYFAPRTVRVNAKNGASDVVRFWVKLSVTKDGETTVLDLAKPADEKLYAELSFTPVGYSSDDVKYTISIPDKDELPQGGIVEEEPYPDEYIVTSDESFTLEVNGTPFDGDFVATYQMAEALSLTHDYQVTGLQYSYSYITIPVKNVEPGAYKLTLTRTGGLDMWKKKRGGGSATSRVCVVAAKCDSNQRYGGGSYTSRLTVDSEDAMDAYVYLYWPSTQLANSAKHMGEIYLSTTFETSANYSFTMHLEKYVAPEAKGDGTPVNAGIMPNKPRNPERPYLLGVDISKLTPGDYAMKLDKPDGGNDDANPPTAMNYSIDDGALHTGGGGRQFLVTVEEGAKTLYLYGTDAGGSAIYSAMCTKVQFWKVNDLTSQTVDITPAITNGNAYYKYPLADGSNRYQFTFTATSALNGVNITSPSTSSTYETPVLSTGSSIIAANLLSGDYTHASGIETYTKSEDAPYKIFCISAADTVPTGLKLKISKQDAASTGFTVGEKKTVTFSETAPVQTFSCHVEPGAYVLSVSSKDDIAGLSVKQGASSVISVLKSDSRTSASAVITVTEAKDLVLTMSHVGSSYPSLDFTLYSRAGAKAFTDNTAASHTFTSTSGVQYFTFTPSVAGVHVLDISGVGANKITVYRSEAGSSSTSAVITASADASDYVSYAVTNFKVGTENTFIFVYGGSDASAEFKFTVHSPKDAVTLNENVGDSVAFGPNNRFRYYTYTTKTAGMQTFDFAASGDGVLTGFIIYKDTSTYLSESNLKDKTYYVSAAISGLNTVDASATFLVWYKGSENVSATLTIHSPKDAAALTDNAAAEGTNFGSSQRVKYFTFQATEAGTHILEFSVASGKSLKGFKLYQDTTSATKFSVTTDITYQQYLLSLDPAATNEGKVTFIVTYEGDAADLTLILHSAKNANAISADTDVSVDFATDQTHIKYYTYTASVAGTYYLEIIGDSVAGYAIYPDSSTSALFSSSTAKYNAALWFTAVADEEGTVSKKASFALVYSGAENSAPVTLKLHTPSGAAAQTVGKAYDTSFAAEGTSWHVQYAKFTPSATGAYYITVTATGDAKLGGFYLYQSGVSSALFSKSSTSDATVSMTVHINGTESTPVILIYFYKGTATATFSTYIGTEASPIAGSLTGPVSVALGTSAEARVKYVTITPTYDVRANLTLASTDGETKVNLARVGVDMIKDGAWSKSVLSYDTTSTATTASRTVALELSKGVKYTFCVYYAGVDDLTVNLSFPEVMVAPTINYTTSGNGAFGYNYIYWNPVFGATQYLVQKQGTDAEGAETWTTVETIDATKGTGIYSYFVYEIKETTKYSYVLRVVAQRIEGEEVKAETTSTNKTVSISGDIRKVTLVFTTPENFPGISGWQVYLDCYNSSGTKASMGSFYRHLYIPAGKQTISYTCYTTPGYSTDEYVYGISYTADKIFTTGGWDVDNSSRTKIDADGTTTITYHFLQPAKYNITVKAPEGYVNDAVKVSLLRGTVTKASKLVKFDGTGDGVQSQVVELDAPIGTYTVKLDLPACDLAVKDDVTVTASDENTTGAAEVEIKAQAKHTVTLNLPDNWVGEAELSVGLFLEEGTSAILTEKVTPDASAKTATVTFNAAFGRNYVAKITAGLPEGYTAADEKTEVMNAATAEAVATGSIAVNQRAKYTVTVVHTTNYTGNTITVQLWKPEATSATYSKTLTVDKEKEKSSVDIYAPIGTYTVKLSSLISNWQYDDKEATTTDSNLTASTEITLVAPYSVTFKLKVPKTYASANSGRSIYFYTYSEKTKLRISTASASTTRISSSTLEYTITVTVPATSDNDTIYIDYHPQQSSEKDWAWNQLHLNAKNGDASGVMEFVACDTEFTVEVTYPQGYPTSINGVMLGNSLHWEVITDPAGKCVGANANLIGFQITATNLKATYTVKVPKGVTVRLIADCGRDGYAAYYLADGYKSETKEVTITESGKTVVQLAVTAIPEA